MPLFQRGARLGCHPNGDRWLVTRKLGEGQFAEVYEVRDTFTKDRDVKYAVKIEKRKESKTVKQEFKVLKRLGQSHRQVCQVYDSGSHDDRFYIVMDLLGENLVEARRAQPGGSFPPAAVGAIGASLLAALEALHEGGYIHRDVKPANFALTLPHPAPATGTWVVIDFGLARRYVGEAGEVLPARSDAAFRGSTTYASVHAHRQLDQGRRDDLWSWLYMLVELLEGTLPWRENKDVEAAGRDTVLQWKEACLAHPSVLSPSKTLPDPLLQISRHIESLGFTDAPDYALLRHHLSMLASCPSSTPSAAWTLPRAADNYYQMPVSTSADAMGQSPPGEGTDPYPTSTYPTARDASDAADVGPSPASPFASAAAAAAAGHHWHKRPPQDPDPGDPHHHRPPRRPRTDADASRDRAANGGVGGGSQLQDAGGGGGGGAGGGAEEGEEEERVQDVRGFVQRFREGGVSAEAAAAVRALCGLDPAEGLGAVATTCELLVARTQPAGLPAVAAFLHSLAAFTQDAARRALLRHCPPPASSAPS